MTISLIFVPDTNDADLDGNESITFNELQVGFRRLGLQAAELQVLLSSHSGDNAPTFTLCTHETHSAKRAGTELTCSDTSTCAGTELGCGRSCRSRRQDRYD